MKNGSLFQKTFISTIFLTIVFSKFVSAKEVEIKIKLGELVANCPGNRVILEGSNLNPLQVKNGQLLAVWDSEKKTKFCLGWCYREALCFNKPKVTELKTDEGSFLLIKGEPILIDYSKSKGKIKDTENRVDSLESQHIIHEFKKILTK